MEFEQDGAKITIDDDLDDRLRNEEGLHLTAFQVAGKIAEVARGFAPVDTGAYRDGIKAQTTPGGARVIAQDHKSAWIEFGIPSRGIPAQFPLRNAAESLGLHFKKGGES